MNDPQHPASFWLGNALLGLALVMLIFLGSLWESFGVWTMGLAGAGMYLVTKDQGPSSNMPD
jgi:hypothetical protein